MALVRKARYLLILVVVGLVGAGVVYLADGPRIKRKPLTAKDLKVEQAEVTIDGFHIANTDAEKQSWDLTAKKARMKKDSGLTKLDDLAAVFNGDGGKVFTLKADSGEFDTNTKAMKVTHGDKDVVITSNDGSVMNAKDLSWDNGKRELTTDNQVSITGKNFRIEGKGLKARADMQEVRITNGVKTVFTPGR